jgi:hypothetical protein
MSTLQKYSPWHLLKVIAINTFSVSTLYHAIAVKALIVVATARVVWSAVWYYLVNVATV